MTILPSFQRRIYTISHSISNTWDFLLKNGVRPIVELSFMPAFIAELHAARHCKKDPKGCTGYWCTQCNRRRRADREP